MLDPEFRWSYNNMKQLACEEQDSIDMESLKQIFKTEIGSVRNCDRIKTIQDLVDCLERNDELSEYNIKPMRMLAEKSHNIAFQKAVVAYVEPIDTYSQYHINQYEEERSHEDLLQKLTISGASNIYSVSSPSMKQANTTETTSSLSMPIITNDKRARIYKKLAEQLGKSWRGFGRELEFTEGLMDEIELQFPHDFKSRVYRVLKLFEEEKDNPNKQFLLICRALDACRRKDLRRIVEDIMIH